MLHFSFRDVGLFLLFLFSFRVASVSMAFRFFSYVVFDLLIKQSSINIYFRMS